MPNCKSLFKQILPWAKKTCQERPHLLSDRFIKVFYKMTTCPRRPLLRGPKSGRLIQVLTELCLISFYRYTLIFEWCFPVSWCSTLTVSWCSTLTVVWLWYFLQFDFYSTKYLFNNIITGKHFNNNGKNRITRSLNMLVNNWSN